MKVIKQFRYYGASSTENYPEDVMTATNLTNGNIFDGYGSITHLGIQGRPGTRFFLNESPQYPIVLGDTGIYELNLEGHGQIYYISFDGHTLGDYDAPSSTDRLLIDIVYEGSGVKS